MRLLFFRLLVLAGVLIAAGVAGYAQAPLPTITFDNKSGKAALVGLIGPKNQTVDVPGGQKRTVNAIGGLYYILTRYGTSSEGYAYSKGDPFTVTQTATQRSVIAITLHPVPRGNYSTHPTSADEFEKATGASSQSAGAFPNDVAAAFLRGKAYADKGQYDRAIEDYDQFLRLIRTPLRRRKTGASPIMARANTIARLRISTERSNSTRMTPTLSSTGAVFTTARATGIVRSPTMTRRSGSIPNTPRPMFPEAISTVRRATGIVRSPTMTRRSGSIPNTPRPMFPEAISTVRRATRTARCTTIKLP